MPSLLEDVEILVECFKNKKFYYIHRTLPWLYDFECTVDASGFLWPDCHNMEKDHYLQR